MLRSFFLVNRRDGQKLATTTEMEPSTPRPSDEYAQVVWAAHILSYLNPYTTIAGASLPDAPQDAESGPSGGNSDSDSDDDLDNESDTADTTNHTATFLGAYDKPIREKFLNCIAELLSHTKGGKHVTATALREREDCVEVDIARNSLFEAADDGYLASLSSFLRRYGTARPPLKGISSADIFSEPDGATDHPNDCCFYPLLEATATYNEKRLDVWVQDLAKLLGPDINHTPPVATPLGPETSNLGCSCCKHVSIPILEAVKRLVGEIRAASKKRKTNTLSVIQLAAVVVQSLDTAVELKRIAPSVNISKALRLFRLIARPLVNLRTLARIAGLLPAFRKAIFIKVGTPGPTQLSRQQIPSLAKAWKRLDITPGGDPPAALLSKGASFKRDCSRSFPVHCEVQLLLRYENDASLIPSLRYFGCSKKACLLCYQMLCLSPLQPRVRGQHGVCHPLWGVGPNHSEELRSRLRELCDVLKERITHHIRSQNRVAPVLVPQSTAASDLGTVDMVELRRQLARRQLVDKNNAEMRERIQIL